MVHDWNKHTALKPTQDDWYGNDKIDRITVGGEVHRDVRIVTVTCVTLRDDKTPYRVCVWGNDDYGLEKDYGIEEEARFNFMKILKMDWVNKQPLIDMGFINA